MTGLLLSQASGRPMIVIPAGTDPAGVPIGAQLIAAHWHGKHLLDIADAITTITGIFNPTRKMKPQNCLKHPLCHTGP